MKNPLIIIICCVIPLAIIGLILFSSGERIDHSSMPKQSTEKQTKVETAVGNIFPAFSVIDVEGVAITNDTLKRRPAIIWFTTSWCIPCQIGALEVARLDNELGGKAFDVLVIFVDLRETENDLRKWRKKFTNEDWIVAFDNEQTKLSSRIRLKFLDSKFILDKKGIIQNIDFELADEDYLNTIRKVIQENS